MAQTVKTIGGSGQLSLGKDYAGKTVVIESPEPGMWIIKTAQVIPDNEMWMLQEPMRTDIDEAIRWAEENPPAETDLDDLLKKLSEHGD
ncbi:MAG: hypothetical protein M3498_00450 [Deinococcota bacterium]|jgi:hypothetical protein|nr:hypothetical protein [Deinococcota bacterium]